MKKAFWQSLTFWGSVLLFIGGGLEAIGVTGALNIIASIAALLGIPMIGFGIRRAIK